MRLEFAKNNDFALHASLFLLCIIPIAVSAFLTTNGNVSTLHLFGYSVAINSVCFFRMVTGYRCPACGMTRCFIYMTHGKLASAWHMSHAGVPLYFLCVFEAVYRPIRLFVAKPPAFKLLKAFETVLIIITGAAIVFFFIAQFINPALVS
jgi:hypothetical protein